MNKAAKILAKRKASAAPTSVLDIGFPVQHDFILNPSKFKALFATRRFGKSYTAGIYLIQEALDNPGCSVLYIALTRDSAKGIMWKDILKVLNRKHKLRMKFNETLLTATLPNGSVLYLMGADSSEDDKNKILGRKFKLAVVDEAASFTINLSELVYGILKPAMADLAGTICMIGTPSNFTRGLFYDITTGKEPGWHLVKANTRDNPYMCKQWLQEILELTINQPYIIDTPMFKQMYLGEWAIDDNKRVYRFNIEHNLYKDLPTYKTSNWTYVLGVDLGWEDESAFVLTGYHINDPSLYVIRTFSQSKMTFDQVANTIQLFMDDKDFAPSKIVVDGANKQGVESMRLRSSIPFEYADKLGKSDFIEMLNADFIQRRVKIHEGLKKLINELVSLVWKTNGGVVVVPRREHPAIPNHLADALLYAWRCGYHYANEAITPSITIGSREWYEKQATNIWERERELMTRKDTDLYEVIEAPFR